MPNRKIHLDLPLTFASKEKRTITGVAIPAGEAVDAGLSKPVTFAVDSIHFEREAIPLLAYHDNNRPVGKLTAHEWTDDGWVTTFKVSATSDGDDILTLASDGVLGLSVGVSIEEETETDDLITFTRASCFEISVTPTPVFSRADITKVRLSKETTMPDADETVTQEFAEGDVSININDTVLEMSQAVVDSTSASEDTTATASMSRPRVVPTPRTRTSKPSSPYPHLFGGRSAGYSFIRDLAMQRGLIVPSAKDAGYAERLEQLRFAVTSSDLPPSEPTTDTSMTVTPSDPSNPLSGIITTRTLSADGGQPFYVLSRDNSGDTALSQPHVEGVEPPLGDIGAWTRQLVEPSAVSGKVAVTREAALANTTPDTEALVFQRMDVARRKAIETNVATSLKNLTLPGSQVKTVGGSNAGDEITAITLDLMYTTDGDRFTTAIVNRQLFGDLVNAKGADGRPLYPILGATNANGTTAPGFRYVNVGGVNVYPVAGLQDGGYMLDPTSVVSWLGPVLEFTFDYELAWIRLAHFQFQSFAVIDSSGVIRLTYSVS